MERTLQLRLKLHRLQHRNQQAQPPQITCYCHNIAQAAKPPALTTAEPIRKQIRIHRACYLVHLELLILLFNAAYGLASHSRLLLHHFSPPLPALRDTILKDAIPANLCRSPRCAGITMPPSPHRSTTPRPATRAPNHPNPWEPPPGT